MGVMRSLVRAAAAVLFVGAAAVPLASPAVAQGGCPDGSGSNGSGSSGSNGSGSNGSGSNGSNGSGSGSSDSGGIGSSGSGYSGSGLSADSVNWLPGSAGSFGSSSHAIPNPNDQGPLPVLSGDTQTVAWVTGPQSPNVTDERFGITGTDLGIAWDNGASGAEHQILMAFGDTVGMCAAPGGQWRSNVLLRSADFDLADGINIPDPQYGNPFGGSPVQVDRQDFSRQIIASLGFAPVEVTVIPTAGIAVGNTQYINYMSVRKWGPHGTWTTNFSAIAFSTNNGETWTTDVRTIRFNAPLDVLSGVPQLAPGNANFQMHAYLRNAGFVYGFGTPNGRYGAARVSRVPEAQMLDLGAYRYWNGSDWVPGAGNAVDVIGAPVAEMSVTWSDYLGEYVALFFNQSAEQVELWTSATPQGPWALDKVLFDAVDLPGGFYAPFIHPASAGNWLYFTLSLWEGYNVMLLRTDLGVVAAHPQAPAEHQRVPAVTAGGP